MLYMFLICSDPTAAPDPSEPSTFQPQHAALERELRAEGVYVSGAALMPVQITKPVRVQRGAVQPTDGPFAETKEVLGGYYIIDCKDADAAVAYAARIPIAKRDWIEVRPIVLFHPDADRIAAIVKSST